MGDLGYESLGEEQAEIGRRQGACRREPGESLREHLNNGRTDGQPKLTNLPFIMLSVSRALGRFPQLNAHYDVKREVITRYEAVHLGVATQTERGLCVPVVRHTEAMDLWQAAREMRRITEAARNHKASALDLYFERGRAKLTLALGRGKKLYDKREDLKRRDAQREMERALRKD